MNIKYEIAIYTFDKIVGEHEKGGFDTDEFRESVLCWAKEVTARESDDDEV